MSCIQEKHLLVSHTFELEEVHVDAVHLKSQNSRLLLQDRTRTHNPNVK